MSDALTNNEIEDVLTSVRRLVAEDVRRPAGGGTTGKPGGRLILTQAQRVDAASSMAPEPENVAPVSSDPEPARPLSQVQPTPAPATQAPLTHTPPGPSPDFRRLEATIAELEAAVSASGSVFEPDGSENAPASNVTALYAKPAFLHSAPPGLSTLRPDQAVKAPEAPGAEPVVASGTGPDDSGDDDADDDGFFETIIDEATLRILVAQIVREELQGQLGERITLQVRKLVRTEIAKALDSRDLI